MIFRPQRYAFAARHWLFGRPLHSSARGLAEALRDESIRARIVRIVDPETGGLSEQGERITHLLKKFDRTRYWLVQVKAGAWDRREEGQEKDVSATGVPNTSGKVWTQPQLDRQKKDAKRREEAELDMALEDLAIVKLVDKKEAYNKDREKRLEKKNQKSSVGSTASAHKEIDLTWSSTSHDIEHKLKTLQTHLRKKGPGARGTVAVRAKAGHGRSGGMEAESKKELIQKIEDYLCNWPEDLGVGEGQSNHGERLYHARRSAEVEWKKEGTFAVLQFQVVKGRKPSA